jgi:hypothetical protein
MIKNPEIHDPRNTRKPSPPVTPFPQAFFAVQEQPQESRLQKEGKCAFHGQRLADNASGKARELRPIGTNLKFHRDAGDYTQREVDAEDLCPEACRFIVGFVAGADGECLEHDDQRRQAHSQLRE